MTDPTATAPAAAPARRGPVVAIDGPAGSGKSTVAARVAAALGVPHVDTGALYRAVTLAVLRAGVDPSEESGCAAVAAAATVTREDGRTFLDGEDVEDEIRGAAVTAAVSAVSAHPGVRELLTPVQRQLAAGGGVIEGRDIGTVVLPDADLKVFLTASVDERARRRAEQLGEPDVTVVRAEVERRDRDDGDRTVAPLVQPPDAVVVDTTGRPVDEVVADVVAAAARSPDDPLSRRRALPRVAVVGRPNVGKSTLVNRVLRSRVAVVEELPGVTRDRTEHVAEWLGRSFLLVDTGGWEHGASGMAAKVVEQAEVAIATCDVAVFVVDATVGALEDDERYARMLRRSGIPVLLAANKADHPTRDLLAHDLYGLGLGEAVPVSAKHGRGVAELLDAVLAELPPGPDTAPDESGVPHVAVVGKPNVGKSSLFNRLLGEERSIVDDVPHTTRDAVDTMIEIDGEPWVFVDTAGMRRRYRQGEPTELYSVDRTRGAIEQADLVLFVVDASEPLSEQDQRLAALVRDARRGVVLVLNKWDRVDELRRDDLERELDRMLSFAAFAPRVNVSALTGRGVHRILPRLREVERAYRTRVPTRELNRWLADAVNATPPPSSGGRSVRVKYVTQPETAPPRFLAFTNGPLPAAYRRYLERSLRERYGFPGVPVHLEDRRSGGRQPRRG